MNFEQARTNMVEQQIRPWEVLDQRVLDHLLATPREDYVPGPYRDLAFVDTRIPLNDQEFMMAPREEARLLQALDVQPGDKVLEVGTGSGYLTALLAGLGREVLSVEISAPLHEAAARKLDGHDLKNVVLELGDGGRGWPSGGPYDAIAVTGSVPILERFFKQQLRYGGRLFVIVGADPVMEARLITRAGKNDWSDESLFETVIPPLVGVTAPEHFEI